MEALLLMDSFLILLFFLVHMGLATIDQKIAQAVDCLVFRLNENEQVELLVVKRKNDPYKGQRSLPGGFVENDETLEDAAQRELAEETGLQEANLHQLYTFSAVDRDPRGRVISTAYMTLLEDPTVELKAASDANKVKFFPVNDLPALSFDHETMVEQGVAHLPEELASFLAA